MEALRDAANVGRIGNWGDEVEGEGLMLRDRYLGW